MSKDNGIKFVEFGPEDRYEIKLRNKQPEVSYRRLTPAERYRRIFTAQYNEYDAVVRYMENGGMETLEGVPLTGRALMFLAALRRREDIVNKLRWAPKDVFVSDGCTLFPDRVFDSDLHEACFWHDVGYWLGPKPGTSKYFARLMVDLRLWRDVNKVDGWLLATTMYLGVRSAGWAFFGWGHNGKLTRTKEGA